MNYRPIQLHCLRLIHDHIEEHGYAPTLRELSRLRACSRVTIFEHLDALERKGAIRKIKSTARAILITEPAFQSPTLPPHSLTGKEIETVVFIARFQKRHGYPPTMPELAKAFKVSKVTIWSRLISIADKGAIKVIARTKRGIRIDPWYLQNVSE